MWLLSIINHKFMKTTMHLQYGEAGTNALITEIPHGSHTMYKVIFESGYENIFFSDVESAKWIEEDLGFTQLAQQLGKQVKLLSPTLFHVPKILTWHKQYIDGKLLLFGFYIYMKGPHKMYEIYNSNKKYVYTLADMDNEEWQILSVPNETLNKIDQISIQHIIQILPFYSNV